MASIINTNIAATRTHNVYNRNNDYMNAAMTRVATGMKINSAKDNASTWAISEKMRERIRANDQANQNIQNDTALLKTAQGGVSNTIDILKTLKERAINAANDSNLTVDRGRIATEVEQLLKQIDDNAEKVQFNGRKLLDGIGKDETVSGFTPTTDSTESTEEANPIKEPTAVTATTDDGAGNSAIYKLAIGSVGDGSDKLVDLGFTAGDKITFSWKADDKEFSKSFTVDENTVLTDLAFDKTDTDVAEGKLSLAFMANGDPLTDQNGVATTGKTSTDAAGLWAVGDRQVAITGFAVSVTYEDTENDNTETTRLDANEDPFQDGLKFSAVQQTTGVQSTHTVMTFSLGTMYDNTNSAAATIDTKITDMRKDSSDSTAFSGSDKITVSWDDENGDPQSDVINGSLGSTTVKDLFTKAGLEVIKADTILSGGGSTLVDSNGAEVLDKEGNTISVTAGEVYLVSADGKGVSNLSFSATDSSDTAKSNAHLEILGTITTTSIQAAGEVKAADDSGGDTGDTDTTTSSAANLVFHIGGEEGFTMEASINSMKVDALFKKSDGTSYTEGEFATLFTTQKGATTALSIIDTALNTALNEQTKLGAMENRLGYASDNLTTMNENLEAADSVMRDSDIAKEMTSYMKYAVLSQASQYMLAQAGQNAFQVLNLLQQ